MRDTRLEQEKLLDLGYKKKSGKITENMRTRMCLKQQVMESIARALEAGAYLVLWRKSKEAKVFGVQRTRRIGFISSGGIGVLVSVTPLEQCSLAESKPEVHTCPSCPLAFGSQQFLSQDELHNHPIPGFHAGNQLHPGNPCPEDQPQPQCPSDKNHRGAEAEDQRVEGGVRPLFWSTNERGTLVGFSSLFQRPPISSQGGNRILEIQLSPAQNASSEEVDGISKKAETPGFGADVIFASQPSATPAEMLREKPCL
ncbi:hypothetical protein H8959_020573 [Pygathrix nigripes]